MVRDVAFWNIHSHMVPYERENIKIENREMVWSNGGFIKFSEATWIRFCEIAFLRRTSNDGRAMDPRLLLFISGFWLQHVSD